MSTLTIGCDTGLTNFGIAVVDSNGTPIWLKSLYYKKKTKAALKDRAERVALLTKDIEVILDTYPVQHICVEMPHRAPSMAGIVTTSLTVGALIALATRRGIAITPIGAKQVRKKVFGNEKIEDEEMYAILTTHLKGLSIDQTPKSRESHALDALATALYLLNISLKDTPNAEYTGKKLTRPKAASRKRQHRMGKGRQEASQEPSRPD